MSYSEIDEQLLQEAYHYINIQKFSRSYEILQKLLSNNPNDAEVLYFSSICLYYLDSYEEALGKCTQALENGYAEDFCYYLLGKIYLEYNKYPDAEKCFLSALNINPEDPHVLAAYARLMLITGHKKKAARLIENARQIDPNNESVLNYYLDYYLSKKKNAEYLQVLGQYMSTSDNEVGKLIKIGLMHYYNDNLVDSKEYFRQAFLLDPSNKDLLELLEAVDKESHILFLPHRFVNKIGGPIVLWISLIVLIFITSSLNVPILTGVIGFVYILYVIYSWSAVGIYKLLEKWRKHHG